MTGTASPCRRYQMEQVMTWREVDLRHWSPAECWADWDTLCAACRFPPLMHSTTSDTNNNYMIITNISCYIIGWSIIASAYSICTSGLGWTVSSWTQKTYSIIDTKHLLVSSDRKLFRNMQKCGHCLNHLLPPSTMILNFDPRVITFYCLLVTMNYVGVLLLYVVFLAF